VITAGLSKAFEAFRLLVDKTLVQIDIDSITSIMIVNLTDGSINKDLDRHQSCYKLNSKKDGYLGSLLFAVEMAKSFVCWVL
jgi:hypothetical protein